MKVSIFMMGVVPRSWRIDMKKYLVRLEAEERGQLEQLVRVG